MSTPKPEPAIARSRSKAAAAVFGDREVEIRDIATSTRTPAEQPTIVAGPHSDPHYIRRERRDTTADHVQLGTRINAALRRRVREFCRDNDETITDLVERSLEYMLDNSIDPRKPR